MVDEQRLEYFVLRYAPNALNTVGANICVVLCDAIAIEAGFCKVGFKPGWESQLLKLDPDADVDLIQSSIRELEQQLSRAEYRRQILELMLDSFSNVLRVSGPKGCLSDNPAQTLEELVAQL